MKDIVLVGDGFCLGFVFDADKARLRQSWTTLLPMEGVRAEAVGASFFGFDEGAQFGPPDAVFWRIKWFIRRARRVGRRSRSSGRFRRGWAAGTLERSRWRGRDAHGLLPRVFVLHLTLQLLEISCDDGWVA